MGIIKNQLKHLEHLYRAYHLQYVMLCSKRDSYDEERQKINSIKDDFLNAQRAKTVKGNSFVLSKDVVEIGNALYKDVVKTRNQTFGYSGHDNEPAMENRQESIAYFAKLKYYIELQDTLEKLFGSNLTPGFHKLDYEHLKKDQASFKKDFDLYCKKVDSSLSAGANYKFLDEQAVDVNSSINKTVKKFNLLKGLSKEHRDVDLYKISQPKFIDTLTK